MYINIESGVSVVLAFVAILFAYWAVKNYRLSAQEAEIRVEEIRAKHGVIKRD